LSPNMPIKAALDKIAALNPWRTIRMLRAANEQLAGAIANPTLTGIRIGNGTIGVDMDGLGPQLVAGMFVGMFEKHQDAKNYIEVTFGSCIGPIVVTVVRPGGKTPDQLRREAERRLAELLGRDDSGKIPAN
jgi:hypothetical protein